MRLYDLIQGDPNPAGGHTPVVVDVTDVARMVIEDSEQVQFPFRESFPKMLPPWPITFFEYHMPKVLRLGKETTRVPPGLRVGVYTSATPADPDVIDTLARSMERGVTSEETRNFRRAGQHAHYLVHSGLYMARRGHEDNMLWDKPTLITIVMLDRDGAFVDDAYFRLGIPGSGVERGEQLSQFDLFFYPAFMATSLLHCKNVSTVDHAPDPKLARARARKGKPPGVVYKTLAIRVPGSKEPVRLGGLGTGIKRGEHIVRGHFAHYTAERPLFGRLTGTFYHPMHVRGRDRDRKIIKDYRLRVDEDAA